MDWVMNSEWHLENWDQKRRSVHACISVWACDVHVDDCIDIYILSDGDWLVRYTDFLMKLGSANSLQTTSVSIDCTEYYHALCPDFRS